MDTKQQFFSPDGYRKLSRNPFIDKKMLQFIKDRMRKQPSYNAPAGNSPDSLHGKQLLKKHHHNQAPMSDQAAKLIAAALKIMLKE